jgi:membrane fusion protein, multidrug efflux system
VRKLEVAEVNTTKPKTTLGLLVAVLAFLSACQHEDTSQPAAADPPVQVQVTHLESGPITRSIQLPAQVIAFQDATLYAKVSGYLKSIAVDKGDKVAAGTVLARIEIPELVAARAKQAAELKAAQADYGRLEESLQKAPDLIVPEVVDQARGRFEVARANLDQSETLLGYATITAPFTGIITRRAVDPGALIQANSPILGLMDFSKVRLQFAVPEGEASRVSVGQTVLVSTENLPGMHFEGRVTRFTYALDPASRTMLTEVVLGNPQLSLRPGMLVTAKIGIEHKDGAPLLPVECLVMEKVNAFVYTVEGNKAVKHPIKIGFNDGKHVEVLDGVGAGEAVINGAGKLKLNNGQAVQVASAP